MLNRSNNVEFIEEPQEQKKARQHKNFIKELLDGSILTRASVVRQLPYLLFVAILAFFYIGNRYHAEKIVRQNQLLQSEIKDLRAEAITTKSELMALSKQSEVDKLLEKKGLGLQESLVPPKILLRKNKK